MEGGNDTGRSGRPRWISVLALGAVFLLALAVRALLYPAVVTPDGVRLPVEADPFYHLRRIVYIAANFPHTLGFDPYLNFPDGARSVWPPAFDWLHAAVARLLGASTAPEVERVAVWGPAVLGALGAVAAAGLLARHHSRRAGLVAGLALALLPAHYFYSQIGYVDHHAAVAVATIALLGAGMGLVGGAGAPGAGRALALGASICGALLLWPGALLHVLLVQAVVLPWALLAASREDAARRAAALAGAHALCALVLWPVGRHPPDAFDAWSPMVLSSFQPAYFGAAAAVLAGFAWLARRTPAGATRGGRIAAALGAGIVGVALALVGIPGLADALFEASGWFGKVEAFQTNVAELQPLLAPRGRFAPRIAVGQFTILLLLFPFAWAWLAWRARRDGAGWDRGLLLAWAGLFFVLAMAQRRFANSFSVAFVLVWTLVAFDVAPRLRAARGWRRGASWVLVGLLGLLCADAVLGFYARRSLATLSTLQDPRLRSRGTLERKAMLAERAAIWLREASPPTSGWLDAEREPEYGVLSGWGVGHLVRYHAQRPLVQDNFGVYGGRENYERAWAYYGARDEETAWRLLERLRVRYVFADRLGAGSIHGYEPRAMSGRLIRWLGSAATWTDPETGTTHEIPALGRHRIVWYGRTGTGAELLPRRPQQAVVVWERVPGARLEGRAAPGARVEATLDLALPGRRRHVWRSDAFADAAGRWTIRVPYPTDADFSDVVRVDGRLRVASGSRSAGASVPEAAVRAGERVPGPDLRP